MAEPKDKVRHGFAADQSTLLGDAPSSRTVPSSVPAPVANYDNSLEPMLKDQAAPTTANGLEQSASASVSEMAAWAPRFHPHQVIADRYEIVRFIGRGGMGEVYEAIDQSLGGVVAMKIVLSSVASDQRVIARFIREIQTARRVTHPNVCRIFDVGYYEGSARNNEGVPKQTPFLTMELLAGETLTERLQRSGRMTTEEALPILEQIAAGLEAAHRSGVIHRDLKSGNVMLVPNEDGMRAVVTDFGLARFSMKSENVSGSISMPDEIVGTPEYMAPEQLKGEPSTPETDIYAFGLLIYVTVTGRLPFEGDSPRIIALKRLEADPPSPRQYLPDLNSDWEKTILRCLARVPADRFHRPAEVVRALSGHPEDDSPRRIRTPLDRRIFQRHWRTILAGLAGLTVLLIAILFTAPLPFLNLKHWFRPGLPEQKRLAILPFVALNGDPHTTAFAKGLAESLNVHLSRLSEKYAMQVIASDEVRGSNIETVRQARQEFGANLAVEGSVEQSGDLVHVTYRIVDAQTLKQLRADTITASTSDPFDLEDKMASSIDNALEIALTPRDKDALSIRPTTTPAAYDFYIQGRGYLQEFVKPENLDSAITEFNHALDLDSTYAPAYAGLGEAYWYKYEQTHDRSWVARANEACGRAVRYADNDDGGHSCLGVVSAGQGNYQLAVQQFQRAVEINPTSDYAVRGLATAYASLGDIVRAENTYKRAIELRPQYWRGYSMLGVFYYVHARYDEAAQMFREVMALAPDNYRGYSNLGGVYVIQGRYSDAIPLFQRAVSIQPTADAYSNLATTYYHLRNFPEAARTFSEAVKLNQLDYEMWGNLADAEERSPDTHQKALADYTTAINLGERELQVNPHDTTVLGNLADYYSMLGKKEQSEQYMKQALALDPKDAGLAFKAAQVFNQLGQTNLAIAWLTRAINAGYSKTIVKDTPALDNIRTDPRVKQIVGSR